MDPKEVSELINYLKEWCLRSPITNTHMDNQGNDLQGVMDTVEPDEEQRLSESSKHDTRTFGALAGDESPSPSPPLEAVPSSPVEMPPSSSFLVEHGNSVLSDLSHGPSPPRPVMVASSVAEHVPIVTNIVSVDIPGVLGVDEDRTMSLREKLPRQRGCEEYEALTDLDKLNYCTAILLPETIRQVLLWQNGMRTSFEMLSPDQEQELYDKGESLLNETEWVFNVKRMRQKAEEVLKRHGTGKRRTQPVDYNT